MGDGEAQDAVKPEDYGCDSACQFVPPTPTGLHIDRIAGRDRNYCDFGGDVVAGFEQSKGEGAGYFLHEQSQTNPVGACYVSGGQRRPIAWTWLFEPGRAARVGLWLAGL